MLVVCLSIIHPKLQFTSDCEGRTGHSGNAMLVTEAFTISDTKGLKRGVLKEFWGPFGFFIY
jgi:hypothetical protein